MRVFVGVCLGCVPQRGSMNDMAFDGNLGIKEVFVLGMESRCGSGLS